MFIFCFDVLTFPCWHFSSMTHMVFSSSFPPSLLPSFPCVFLFLCVKKKLFFSVTPTHKSRKEYIGLFCFSLHDAYGIQFFLPSFPPSLLPSFPPSLLPSFPCVFLFFFFFASYLLIVCWCEKPQHTTKKHQA